ncbi:hypothetical protein ASPBRDRAFT_56067 [Aspergillus brasiliensis CBS 101740]|uniref:Uncharacterized protein n=1 Tax=Aspergillus brasiliensis (strain CBS 101740 / IMI 381727 / IBT 21946) TaxID=767769 RepID=A0A1L9UIL4_ASPBC|nr:hypothetical protein ASPBRDRAFT_56067 [Aspergillus brasiliensis CBS 101740]
MADKKRRNGRERKKLPKMNDCTNPEILRIGGFYLSGLDGPFHFHSFVCLTGCGEERQSLVYPVVPYCGRGNTEHMPRIRKVWYGHLSEEEVSIYLYLSEYIDITECEVDTGITSVWNTSSLVMVDSNASSWALWQMSNLLLCSLFTFLCFKTRVSKVAVIP